MTFALYASIAAGIVGLLLIAGLVWWARKFESEFPEDPGEWRK